jgi:hypothetical protein
VGVASSEVGTASGAAIRASLETVSLASRSFALQKLLGHTTLTVTRMYVDLVARDLRTLTAERAR